VFSSTSHHHCSPILGCSPVHHTTTAVQYWCVLQYITPPLQSNTGVFSSTSHHHCSPILGCSPVHHTTTAVQYWGVLPYITPPLQSNTGVFSRTSHHHCSSVLGCSPVHHTTTAVQYWGVLQYITPPLQFLRIYQYSVLSKDGPFRPEHVNIFLYTCNEHQTLIATGVVFFPVAVYHHGTNK